MSYLHFQTSAYSAEERGHLLESTTRNFPSIAYSAGFDQVGRYESKILLGGYCSTQNLEHVLGKYRLSARMMFHHLGLRLAHISIIHRCAKATDETGASVRVLLFDCRKAFDFINHNIRVTKIRRLSISLPIVKLEHRLFNF